MKLTTNQLETLIAGLEWLGVIQWKKVVEETENWDALKRSLK